MEYIDVRNKRIIVETPLNASINKYRGANGELKEHTKYTARMPYSLLLFLLQRYTYFDYTVADCSARDFLDKVLFGNTFYLGFYRDVDTGNVLLRLNKSRDSNADASVSIQRHYDSKSYRFTLSKRVFSELSSSDCNVRGVRFVLPLYDSFDSLENFVLFVELL